MRRWAAVLACLSMLQTAARAELVASFPPKSQDSELLVPEGEDASILEKARWQAGHPINAVKFSPNGKLLATGSDDNIARLFEAHSGKELVRMLGHTAQVSSVRFSPDGKLLATGSLDRTARVFEVSSGKQFVRPLLHAGWVTSVNFSPNGKLLATGSTERNGTARVFEVPSGKELIRLQGFTSSVASVSFSPDGRFLATGTAAGAVRVFEIPSGKERVRLSGHSTSVTSVSFSPDGKLLATGSEDRTVRVLVFPSGKELARMIGHTGSVTSVDFSPDGKLLATGSEDQTARVFEIPSGKELVRMLGHNMARVRSVSFSPDGKLLAVGPTDGTARVFEVPSGKELVCMLGRNTAQVSSVSFSPDGELLATGSEDQTARVFEVPSGKELVRLAGHSGSVTSVNFSPDGKLLATGSEDRTARVFEVPSGEELVRLPGHSGSVASVSFSPDGKLLATASYDLNARVFGILSSKELVHLPLHSGSVTSVSFSPDGKFLATGSFDRTVRVFEVPSGKELVHLQGYTGLVTSVSFSPDGKRLATGSADGTARVFEVPSGKELVHLQAFSRSVTSVGFSSDGKLLAIGLLVLTTPDGTTLDQTARVFEVLSGKEVVRLQGLTDSVTSVSFSPNGKVLVTGSSAGNVILWRLPDGIRIGQIWPSPFGWVFERNGRVYRHDDGRVLYRKRTDGLLESIAPPSDANGKLPKLSAEVIEKTFPGEGSATGVVQLRVSNAPEAGRAYWIAVTGRDLPAALGLIPPPTHLRLEPGETVVLPIVVSSLTRQGEPAPERGLSFELAVSHSHGEGPTVRVQIDRHAPHLSINASSRNGLLKQAIEITILGDGDQDPDTVSAEAVFIDSTGKELRYEAPPSQEFSAHELAPGREKNLSFAFPESLRKSWWRYYFKPMRVKLTLRGSIWPTHLWAPVTRPMGAVGAVLAVLFLVGALAAGLLIIGWIRLNPIVRAVGRDTFALGRYALFDLPQVEKALRRAGRLEESLIQAKIADSRWRRTVQVAKNAELASATFATAIGARLGDLIADRAYALDMPPLLLRFAQRSAVLSWTGAAIEAGELSRLCADLRTAGLRTAFALDLSEQQQLANMLRESTSVKFVVFSASDLRDLLLSPTSQELLEVIIARQLPISDISPYQTTGGVDVPQMFFGREPELETLGDERLRNYLLVGPRQMGKTSLLKALERRVKKRGDAEVHFVTLASGDLAGELASRLNRQRPQNPAELYALCAGTPKRPRLWLLDEADLLVQSDRDEGQGWSRTIRALAEERLAYFVLSGFWLLYAAAVLDPQHPFRNFGKTLSLGPLSRTAGRLMATQPMTALQLTYESESLIDQILDVTGRRANLIAEVCSGLIETLDRSQRVFTAAHLQLVLHDYQPLRRAFKFWDARADRSAPSPYQLSKSERALDRAVVEAALLCAIAGPPPSLEELQRKLAVYGRVIPTRDLRASLERQELAYVLVPDHENRYACPIPLLKQLIAEDPEQPLAERLREDMEDIM